MQQELFIQPENDNAALPSGAPHWTAERWRAHVARMHPAHAANSYAFHREQFGHRMRPAFRVLTALVMTGSPVDKAGRMLAYDEALAWLDARVRAREARRAA